MTNTDLRTDADAVAPGRPDGPPETPTAWQPVKLPGLRLLGVLVGMAVVGVLVPWVLVVILGLLVMIFLHELGHFVMARRADMKVTEFFLGFGPRIWSFKRGEVEYGLKAIPAGAYVKIIGMTNLEEVAPADEARTYRQKSFAQRVGVAVAGSTMHFLLALVLIFVTLVAFGSPGGKFVQDPANWVVGNVVKGSAAAQVGLATGDRILSIDGKKVGSFDSMVGIVSPRRDKQVTLEWRHGGEVRTSQVKLHSFTDTVEGSTRKGCCLGVGEYHPKNSKVGVVEAIPATLSGFGATTRLSLDGFGRLFSPSGISGFAGQVADGGSNSSSTSPSSTSPGKQPSGGSSSAPSGSSSGSSTNANRFVSIIGVVQLGSDIGAQGASALLAFFALINIFIGLFNLIPLLPFDGGHVALAVFEKAQEVRLRRRGRYFADAARLLPLTYVVVGLLGLLFISTAYLDIISPLSLK